MKWDQERPAKAAVERCRVCLDSPPTGDFGFSFLIYPPTRAQWRARAGGLRGGFPNPAKLICMGFAKNGLASSQPHKGAAPHPAQRAKRPAERDRVAGGPRTLCCGSQAPGLCSAFSLLIYPPTTEQWRARAGGLRRGFPSSAEPICMGFAKNGLASSHTRKACGGPPAAWARAAYPSRATYPIPPAYLPYTPGTPTLYPRRTHPIPPGPPASRPTAYLPQHTYPTLLADLP